MSVDNDECQEIEQPPLPARPAVCVFGQLRHSFDLSGVSVPRRELKVGPNPPQQNPCTVYCRATGCPQSPVPDNEHHN